MTSTSTPAEAESPSKPRRLPGVEGVWVFVGADSVMFALLFGSYMSGRSRDRAGFETARQALSLTFGGINTLILLTSSWFVILGVQAARNAQPHLVPRRLAGAAALGVAFTVSKALEYGHELTAGSLPGAREFFMWYFSLTGLHLAHVLAGTVILALMWRRARAGGYAGEGVARLEGGATFWHMVDYLWVVIFPLLYLLR